ncbi:PDZ domain-containing protein [Atopobacter sp. AH10]|uniref:S41 family peptidase n=1 Tax=Atopobacter sp. AH10 TaxID=2315861 RepID=UPI000EF23A1D|nr:S41 family peptidase [Atopobacter sp. AH10]RLK63396.1 PDZ domain-containing protein [Atopobacter sp. AH10]
MNHSENGETNERKESTSIEPSIQEDKSSDTLDLQGKAKLSSSDEKKDKLKHFFFNFWTGLLSGVMIVLVCFIFYKTVRPTSQLKAKDIEKLDQVYSSLSNGYVKKLSSKQLVDGAIKGMAEATEDPFTQYLNEKDTASFSESMDAQFEGIGASLSLVSKRIIIIAPIKGSPAEKAGLEANDEIIKVNGRSVEGKSLAKVVASVRGKKGTEVRLTIKRGNKEQEYKLKRDTIPIETVNASIDEKHPEVGIIEVTNFAKPTSQELQAAIQSLRSKGVKRFVLDFRSNPGGLLDQALAIANMFVKNGQNLMQTEDRDHKRVIYKASDQLGSLKVTEPTVMLINGGSASASEIVAGALKESAGIPLVGEKSFGKGTVQTVQELANKTELKFTVNKWLTPKGNWIHRLGIQPTDPIEPAKASKLLMVISSDKLVKGKENEEILNLNLVLRELGYQLPAAITYDDSTESAIKSFQQAHHLKVTGQVDDDTAASLTQSLRDQLKTQDPQKDAAIKKVLELNYNAH